MAVTFRHGRARTRRASYAAARQTTRQVPCAAMSPAATPDRLDDGGLPAFEKLSVFYPMWNEEAYIERALAFGKRACDQLVASGDIGDYELIVVDDASTDATGAIADRMAAEDPRVRVVHHAQNRKLGGAMKTGFASATGDVVLYTDADLPFDMAELPRAVRLMREYDVDIVSAYRFDRTGEGSLRAVYTFVYNALIKALFGVRVRDINFAFKLCRRRIFDHVELRSEGSFIDAELVIRATRLGFEILQMGVDYFPRTRGESTLSSPAVIGTIVREMFQLRNELEQITPLDGDRLTGGRVPPT
jgi:glycosyltransferase involved in cell wall biosynthesis